MLFIPEADTPTEAPTVFNLSTFSKLCPTYNVPNKSPVSFILFISIGINTFLFFYLVYKMSLYFFFCQKENS